VDEDLLHTPVRPILDVIQTVLKPAGDDQTAKPPRVIVEAPELVFTWRLLVPEVKTKARPSGCGIRDRQLEVKEAERMVEDLNRRML
jgi:hypothetical protein